MSTVKDDLFSLISSSKEAHFSSFMEMLDRLNMLNACSTKLLLQIIDNDTEMSVNNRKIFFQLGEKWTPRIEWTVSVFLSINEDGQKNSYFVLHLLSTLTDIEKSAYSYLRDLKKIFNRKLLCSSDEAVINHLHILSNIAIDDGNKKLLEKIEWFMKADFNVDIVEYSEDKKDYFDVSDSNSVDCDVTTEKAIINKNTKELICQGVVCKPLKNN